MEIYIIAVIVGCIQIPIVCDLLVGTSCDDIQPQLDALVLNEKMSHATCFNMLPTVKEGLWYQFFASITLFICSVTVRELANLRVSTTNPLRKQQRRVKTERQSAYYSDRLHYMRLFRMVKPLEPELIGSRIHKKEIAEKVPLELQVQTLTKSVDDLGADVKDIKVSLQKLVEEK
jgi:hypothetical protein